MPEDGRPYLIEPRRIALVCGLTAALLGAAVLVAWATGHEGLKHLRPGWPTMKANTALAFLASGLALAARGLGRRPAAIGLAAVPLALGALSLAQYAFGVDLGIDEMLVQDNSSASATTSPGRMAILTAAGFLLVSLALLGWTSAGWVGATAAWMAAFVALFNLAFYFLGALPPLDGTRMAVHTAGGFLVLTSGLLLGRPSTFSDLMLGSGDGSRLARRLLGPVVALPLVLGWWAHRGAEDGVLTAEQAFAFALFGNLSFLMAIATLVLLRVAREERQLAAAAAERERDRTALAESARRTDLAEDATGRGSWEWDVTTDRSVWSRGMYRLFGVDPATFRNTNENFLAMVHPDDRARMGQAIADALAKPGTFFQEYRLRRPDGQEIYVRGEGNVRADAGGAARMVYGYVQDVTRLKSLEAARAQAEAAVRASETRFRLLFETNPVAFALSRSDGSGLLDVNPAYERLLGYPRAEVLAAGFDVASIYAHPAHRPKVLAEIRQQGSADALEVDLRRKDGAVRKVIASIRALDVDGAPAFLTALQDITEMREAEAAASRARERFQRIFEASPIPILLSKADGRIEAANAAMTRMLGYSLTELTAPGFTALRLYDDPQERDRILLGLRSSGAVRDRELALRTKAGGIVHVLIALEFIDLGGNTTILSLFQDITELKRAQQEREGRIAQEAELERLRRTDQFRAEFINSTAHELRTPMTPLLLNLASLRRDVQGNEAALQRLATVERAAERLRRVIGDMVSAADLQARAITLDRQRLNLTRQLAAAIAGHQEAAHRANVTLELGNDGGLTVLADEQRLQLVLGHLLGNALKFTPAGGAVRVATRLYEGQARVEVADTGVGLTAREMEALWRPYSQAHDKTQRTDSGSGLGLFVAKGVIDLHGGTVGVDSRGPGHGSTFWFTLPLAPGNVDPLAKASRSPHAHPEDNGPRRNLNPSVREDDLGPA